MEIEMESEGIPVTTDQVIILEAQISKLHAQIYSNFAERKNVISELLRWRKRLQFGNAQTAPPELKAHLVFLKRKARALYMQRLILENEYANLVVHLNLPGNLSGLAEKFKYSKAL